ncbi:hypothetical protein ONS95_014453 [Cadophora gregata]|uniref:uncharacterized protein n=1 Tax=Cadophora gregata TaxID=51156 RepID=UPI0026DBFA89|nr:uncharacterized protein ONS95_014453 [Cadophora gregata]KAK0112717.1 hypothetical protein ONS95_014453 [Cadophora gregata]KAK0124850.1 hypothetical protein ONS96_008729 [Cadophora gregata f. sp. sojae]
MKARIFPTFLLVTATLISFSGALREQISGSTVIRLGDIAYYMYDVPEIDNNFGMDQMHEPCTVIEVGSAHMCPDSLDEIITRFGRSDDVWSKAFLRNIVIQTNGGVSSVRPDTQQFLSLLGTRNIYYSQVLTKSKKYPEGPYFLDRGKLHQAYRLYPDTSESFIVATVPTHDPFHYKSLDAAAYGETYPSALTVAVPSRLYFTKTDEQPYAGLRLGIKDIIDLKGLRTGASFLSYTALYGPRDRNAAVVQRLLKLGMVVVGKMKTTQFADSEWATCDYVDYHAPFNPRADGYQGPSGSSAGSAAAIASYEWLDFTIGTDTLGSTRAPATVQGIFGMRPSIDTANFEGIIPYSDKFDTVGGFARDAAAFTKLAKALYGPEIGSGSTCETRPAKILYPVNYWPVSHGESQEVFERFVAALESHLGVKRFRIDLEDVWRKTNPVKTNLSLAQYFEHVFEWVANPDQWTGFMKQFFEDYAEKFGQAASVNPQLQFKRDYLPTVTKEQQKEGTKRLRIFSSWWENNVIPSSDTTGCIDTIMVIPWSNGEPEYRDKYRESAQKFTGIGFFFYNLSPYAGAPELIVPGKQAFTSPLAKTPNTH